MLNSKRWLVVLVLHIVLSLEMVHMPKMELGIGNWNSSTGSLIGIFKYIKVRGRNKKLGIGMSAAASVDNSIVIFTITYNI